MVSWRDFIPSSFDRTKLLKKCKPEKNWRPINHGLTLVNKPIANYNKVAPISRRLQLLFQDFHSDHFDAGIANIDNFEFVIADNDAVLQAGNSAMLIDDIAGKRL